MKSDQLNNGGGGGSGGSRPAQTGGRSLLHRMGGQPSTLAVAVDDRERDRERDRGRLGGQLGGLGQGNTSPLPAKRGPGETPTEPVSFSAFLMDGMYGWETDVFGIV